PLLKGNARILATLPVFYHSPLEGESKQTKSVLVGGIFGVGLAPQLMSKQAKSACFAFLWRVQTSLVRKATPSRNPLLKGNARILATLPVFYHSPLEGESKQTKSVLVGGK
ncbi:MAG: hypothetical protein ACR2PJ_08225, partial [Pseudomonadales bacterium]